MEVVVIASFYQSTSPERLSLMRKSKSYYYRAVVKEPHESLSLKINPFEVVLLLCIRSRKSNIDSVDVVVHRVVVTYYPLVFRTSSSSRVTLTSLCLQNAQLIGTLQVITTTRTDGDVITVTRVAGLGIGVVRLDVLGQQLSGRDTRTARVDL